MSILRGLGLLVILLSGLGCNSREHQFEQAFDRGVAATDQHDYATAVAEFSEAIRLDPENSAAFHNRGYAYVEIREYARAISDYNEAIRLDPDDSNAYTGLSWLLATCPQDDLRNGKRAVELATRACELTGWKDANDIENLAAGHAECGQFDEAVKWQTNAVKLGTGLDNIEESRRRLELFKSGKPFRDKGN